MKNKRIQFLSTSGCHLCEQAHEMARYLMKHDPEVADTVNLEMIDIANDDALVEQYGIRIPVLVCLSRELGWPFELEELRSWLIEEVTSN